MTRATASRRTSGARASGSATSSTPTAAPAVIRWAARRRARSRELSRRGSRTRRAAWDRRIQSGQAGGGMSARFTQVGRAARAGDVRGLDRSHRRRASCRRPTPPRPQGKERNVVVTMWDWADPKVYLHDEIASDKRNPDRQRQRPDLRRARRERRLLLGRRSEDAHGESMIKLDRCAMPTRRAPRTRRRPRPSPYWGDEAIWNSQTTVHSFAMDKQARVWAAARVRKPADAGVVPGRIGSSVRKAVPDQSGAARPR